MGDLTRLDGGGVADFMERMREKQLAEAKAAGFESIEEHEQHRADEIARQWARARAKALPAARRATIRASGSLVSRDAAEMLALGRQRPTRAIEHTRRWLKSDRPMLVLCGPPGTGKSVAAAWCILEGHNSELVRRWEDVESRGHMSSPNSGLVANFHTRAAWGCGAVVHAPRIPQTFDPWRGEAEDDRPLLRWDHRLLVIDDLGTEQATSRWSETFGHLIDERLASPGCRTVITTNLLKSDIRDRYGDRIADRWNAHAAAVELRGESMRGKGQGL